eukprot:PhM_4_TR604/c0_g1_i1/m.26120
MHSLAEHHPDITYVWETTTGHRQSVYEGHEPRDSLLVAESFYHSSSTWDGEPSPPPWHVFDVARLVPVLVHRAGLSPLSMLDNLHFSSDVNTAMKKALLGEMFGSSVFSSDVFECELGNIA